MAVHSLEMASQHMAIIAVRMDKFGAGLDAFHVIRRAMYVQVLHPICVLIFMDNLARIQQLNSIMVV